MQEYALLKLHHAVCTGSAAVPNRTDLMDLEPMDLRNRQHSMGTHEVAQGSWAVGRCRDISTDDAKMRRSSLTSSDSAAVRNALRNPGHTYNVDVSAGERFSG